MGEDKQANKTASKELKEKNPTRNENQKSKAGQAPGPHNATPTDLAPLRRDTNDGKLKQTEITPRTDMELRQATRQGMVFDSASCEADNQRKKKVRNIERKLGNIFLPRCLHCWIRVHGKQ